MRKILRVIDSITEYTGKAVTRWLVAAVVLIMTYEVIMRYIFNSPTMWTYETAIMLGAAICALGWSYAHRCHSHIRIDVFYTSLSPRTRASIDVIGSLFLFFPLITILMIASFKWTVRAWLINERMMETFWFPPSAPLRTVVMIGFCLFALQGMAQFIRDFYFLVRNKPL